MRVFWRWRVLDARYWQLAQRRERVFFVGSLGDWRGPAAVLSFAEGMRGYPEKGSQAGQGVAKTLSVGSGGSCGHQYRQKGNEDAIVVAHALRAEGFDASEDGTGRGTPLVPVVVPPLVARSSRGGAQTLSCGFNTDGHIVPVAYGGNNTAGPIDVATAVNAHGGPHGRLDFESETFVAQAFHGRQDPDLSGEVTHPVDTDGHSIAVAFQDRFRGDDGRGYSRPPPVTEGVVGTLETVKPWHVAAGLQVRRLTPRECERLQGFPDDFTLIDWRPSRLERWIYGKPAADGPRYRAIGNSMAVPCLKWLLTRIEAHATAAEGSRMKGGNRAI